MPRQRCGWWARRYQARRRSTRTGRRSEPFYALATAEAGEHLEASSGAAATVLNEIAVYHYARAAYAEAEPLYKRALSIRKKALDPDHPSVGSSRGHRHDPERHPGRGRGPRLRRRRSLQQRMRRHPRRQERQLLPGPGNRSARVCADTSAPSARTWPPLHTRRRSDGGRLVASCSVQVRNWFA